MSATQEQLQGQVKSSASWFSLITRAGMFNCLLTVLGVKLRFIFALGLTDMVSVVAKVSHAGLIGTACAVLFTLLAAGGARFLESFASRGFGWAFKLGLLLYGLDAGLWVLVGHWVEVIAHGFALLGLWNGLTACRQLSAQRSFRRPEADA